MMAAGQRAYSVTFSAAPECKATQEPPNPAPAACPVPALYNLLASTHRPARGSHQHHPSKQSLRVISGDTSAEQEAGMDLLEPPVLLELRHPSQPFVRDGAISSTKWHQALVCRLEGCC